MVYTSPDCAQPRGALIFQIVCVLYPSLIDFGDPGPFGPSSPRGSWDRVRVIPRQDPDWTADGVDLVQSLTATLGLLMVHTSSKGRLGM